MESILINNFYLKFKSKKTANNKYNYRTNIIITPTTKTLRLKTTSLYKYKKQTYNLVNGGFFSLKDCTSMSNNRITNLYTENNNNKILYINNPRNNIVSYTTNLQKLSTNSKLSNLYNNKILYITSKINATNKTVNSTISYILDNTTKKTLPIYLDKSNIDEPFTNLNINLTAQAPLIPIYDNFSLNKKPKSHLLFFKNIKKLLPNPHINLNYSTEPVVKCITPHMFIEKQHVELLSLKYNPYINLITSPVTHAKRKNQPTRKHIHTFNKYWLYKPISIPKTHYLPLIYHTPTPTKSLISLQNGLYSLPTTSKIKSRVNNKLTLINLGIFLLKNLNTLTHIISTKYKYIYKIKKSLYSFTKPNQIKNIVLKRKASLVFYKLIFLSKNKTYQTKSITDLTKNSIISNYFRQNLNLHTQSLFKPTKTITNPTNYGNNYEIRLSRVRFKPGYQRLWRDSRTALKDLIGLKFIYQKQLTKYIIRFYKKTYQPTLSPNELHLSKLAIYSRIAPDYSTFNLFYNSNLFFINGLVPTNKNIVCVLNDFVQLVVSKWYYIFFRWLSHWTLVRFRKIKRLIYRKGLSSRYKVMKSRKQKSNTVPDWIFLTKYDFSDVKPFIEVDYFTLSFSLIYEPYLNYYYAPTNLLSPKINIYRLYNWKYIT